MFRVWLGFKVYFNEGIEISCFDISNTGCCFGALALVALWLPLRLE